MRAYTAAFISAFDQIAGGEQGHRVGAYVWRHAFRPTRECKVKFLQPEGKRYASRQTSGAGHRCTANNEATKQRY